MTELRQSYVHGTSDTPLIGATVGTFFDRIAAQWHDRDALICRHQNIRWRYGELKRRVDEVAAGLLAMGLEKGDRLGIWSHNNAEWVVTQLATARVGIILVNINPAYRSGELEYALNKVGCKALVTNDAFKTSNYLEMLQSVAPEIADARPGQLHAQRVPALRTVIRLGEDKTAGMYNFSDIAALTEPQHYEQAQALSAELQFDDPINIQFTSGTTGQPKGATLTHHNILNNGFFIGETMCLSEQDRLCIPVPLYHCFGMVLGNLACLTHGACIVYPDEAFEPRAVLEAVAAERCTGLHGVPTMFIAELNLPDFADYDLSSLRTGIMAGSPCPAEIMKQVREHMHMSDITICYGMTETSPVSFQTSVDAPVDKRVATVGRIHPHVEVKMVDENDRIVPVNTPGELCTRGYPVMLGYWGDAERTSEVIDDAGWMHTDDLAMLDEQGYCSIVGRMKDMVIRGGENIYPLEIEEFLYRHEAIQDVQVIGVPDQRFGEELCAWISLREGASADEGAIRAFCEGQIAHYKIPRYIRFVEEFPMTVTGKVQKFVMREKMMQELGLGNS